MSAETTATWGARYSDALMNTFGPPKTTLVRGAGARVWDADGKEYVDFLGGIAVNTLGHAHPALVRSISEQAATLIHTSNFFATPPQIALAERLLALLGIDGRVFFTNSGTEANEAAFKLTRRTGRTRIVATEGGFHGRTMGALALTSKEAYRTPFEPLPGHVTFVPYGDVAALDAALDDSVAAVLIEPVQGEAGVIVPPRDYLAEAQRLAHNEGALLWLDEVQTGIGRTGSWFAHQNPDLVDGAPGSVVPDIVTLAKGLAGGVPIGACIATGGAGKLFDPGNHGTTFGGNPLAAAAALTVLETIAGDELLAHSRAMGERLRAVLDADDRVLEVRGCGLMIGIDLSAEVAPDVVAAGQDAGFILNATGPNRMRFVPPLVVAEADVDALANAWSGILDAGYAAHHEVGAMTPRHFLRDDDLSPAEQAEVLRLAAAYKKAPYALKPLAGPRTVAMIFDKLTLRTQSSFSAGIAELGGHPLAVDGHLAKIGERESVADVARVLGRQVAAIVWRTYAQSNLEEMGRFAGVPVINALTDEFHPCQLLADLLTIAEHKPMLAGLRVAFLGDAACNMGNSWAIAGAMAGLHVQFAAPEGCTPDPAVLARAGEFEGSVATTTDPVAAVTEADVVVTDTWISMGKEDEAAERRALFGPYAVTAELMSHARPDAIVLHCLPAYRGSEIAADVLDGPQSVVWDEAENRRHVQKALLAFLMSRSGVLDPGVQVGSHTRPVVGEAV